MNTKPNLAQLYKEAPVSAKERKDPFLSLTNREEELCALIAIGQTNKDIADRLNISENTVRNHIASIMSKLKARNRTEVAFLYGEHMRTHRDNERQKKESQSNTLHPLEQKYGRL